MKYLLLFLVCPVAFAEESPLKFGGFLDTYYAYDFNNPANREREYTTQPVRHNEFNVNLAYVDATLNKENLRGRLALQMGQSVTKNTVGEPRLGSTSGPQDAKIFQEAYLGKRIGEKTWIDVGIFLGNIGAESWISKDNWTYTRALNLDYVPYYSSGIRLEHFLNEKESLQFQVLNGWQNMSENNNAKAIGMQYKNLLSERSTFTYNNFFGDEQVVSTRSRFRAYHNFIFKFLHSERWQYLMAFDIGHQSQQNNKGVDAWYTSTITVRRVLDSIRSLALRMEYYNDRHQANVVTGTPQGFQVMGSSLNYDQKLDETALWRTELRGFYSKDGIFPATSQSKNRWDGVLVSSLSFWL